MSTPKYNEDIFGAAVVASPATSPGTYGNPLQVPSVAVVAIAQDGGTF